MGNLKKRVRKMEIAQGKELERAVEEFVSMVLNSLRSMANNRRIWLLEELRKIHARSGNFQVREPQGIKQLGMEAIEAMQVILSIIAKIDSEVRVMVIERLRGKIATYPIYWEVITISCDGQG